MRTLHVSLLFAALVALLPNAGCYSRRGPAERAGEQIDDAVDDAADTVEDLGDRIEDETDRPARRRY